MNDDEFYADAIKTGEQHVISLDFECAKCGETLAMTMHPANPPDIPCSVFSIGCDCTMCSYTEDPGEMTPERWADIVRSSKEGED